MFLECQKCSSFFFCNENREQQRRAQKNIQKIGTSRNRAILILIMKSGTRFLSHSLWKYHHVSTPSDEYRVLAVNNGCRLVAGRDCVIQAPGAPAIRNCGLIIVDSRFRDNGPWKWLNLLQELSHHSKRKSDLLRMTYFVSFLYIINYCMLSYPSVLKSTNLPLIIFFKSGKLMLVEPLRNRHYSQLIQA